MRDEDIVELYWQRNEQAITETSNKYEKYCYTISYNILGNVEDCHECVNDTWLSTWNSIPPNRPYSLKMYVARIVRNLSFNRYESMTAQKRNNGQMPLVLDELQECIASDSNVEGEVMARELGRTINRFISSLPETEGNVFIRRYFYSEAVKDIARRYGLKANNVAVMLTRCRAKLKDYLKEEGYM